MEFECVREFLWDGLDISWHSSFFSLQQKSLRAHSCFSEAFFRGTRKDHAKRSLANHGRQSLVKHAKLSLRNPGRCESQSEFLSTEHAVMIVQTQVSNPWKHMETSGLFQKGQSWEFAEHPYKSKLKFQHWICHPRPSKSYQILVLLRCLRPAHSLLVWVSAWRMEGCVTTSNRPEVPVAVPPVHQSRQNFESSGDFPHTVDGKRNEQTILSCTMLQSMGYVQCQLMQEFGPWTAVVFFWFAGREKTRLSDVLLEIHRWSYHLCLLPGSLQPSEFSVDGYTQVAGNHRCYGFTYEYTNYSCGLSKRCLQYPKVLFSSSESNTHSLPVLMLSRCRTSCRNLWQTKATVM